MHIHAHAHVLNVCLHACSMMHVKCTLDLMRLACYIIIITFIALDGYGWKHCNGKLEVVWEVQKNITKVQERLEYTFTGCKCKTGCANKRCGCRKKGKGCGPGCKCLACTNTHDNSPEAESSRANSLRDIVMEENKATRYDGDDEMVEDSEDDLSDMEEDEETDEIMKYVFGDIEDSDDEY